MQRRRSVPPGSFRRCGHVGRAAAASPAAGPASAGAAYTAPRTPWGDPDLQGMWPIDKLNGTPVQRPRDLRRPALPHRRRVRRARRAAARLERALRRGDREQQDGHRPLGRDGRAEQADVADRGARERPRAAADGRGRAPLGDDDEQLVRHPVRQGRPTSTRSTAASRAACRHRCSRSCTTAASRSCRRRATSSFASSSCTRRASCPSTAARRSRPRSCNGSASRAAGSRATRSSSRPRTSTARSPMLIVGPGGKPIPTSREMRIVERLTRIARRHDRLRDRRRGPRRADAAVEGRVSAAARRRLPHVRVRLPRGQLGHSQFHRDVAVRAAPASTATMSKPGDPTRPQATSATARSRGSRRRSAKPWRAAKPPNP